MRAFTSPSPPTSWARSIGSDHTSGLELLERVVAMLTKLARVQSG